MKTLSFSRNYHRIGPVFFALAALILFSLLLPSVAHADGGAPNLAYVSGTAKGISVIDVAQQAITRTLSVSDRSQTIQLSMDARFLYVTEPQIDRLAILVARTGQTLCTAHIPGHPSLLAVDKSTGELYVAGSEAPGVSAVDPTTCAIIQIFYTTEPVYGLAVTTTPSQNNENALWVATTSELIAFDPLKGKIINHLLVAEGPQYLLLPPGNTLYVTTRQGNTLAVDLTSLKVFSLLQGSQYGPMDFDETTGEVYVPDERWQRLDVLTPVNADSPLPHEPVRTIALNALPQSVAITSDGQLGFVALADGHVAMLDVPGRQVTNIFAVAGNPSYIITGLYPPIVGTTPQQVTVWDALMKVTACILMLVLLVPLLVYRRYSQAKRKTLAEVPLD